MANRMSGKECGIMKTISIGNGNTLLTIKTENSEQIITMDMLRPIWHDISNGSRDDIEYLSADLYDDLLVCCAYVSQGQGGIVFVWDTSKEKIVHYSDGNFAVKAAINNDIVYVLRMVSFWGQEAHLEMDCCPLGTMEEDNDVSAVELDEETAHLLINDPQNYVIEFDSEDRPIISVVSHD